MAFAAPSIKGRALRLLSQREHSRPELERKLARYQEEPGSLALALDDLAAKGFISEARVVASVLHQSGGKLGPARVKQLLQQKGIAPEAVASAVAGLRDNELENALALWRRRFDAPPTDARAHTRQARFLMARGFSGATVSRVLRLTGRADMATASPTDESA
ncbi:MAG: recombination regulator RecX [Variovorax sp.]